MGFTESIDKAVQGIGTELNPACDQNLPLVPVSTQSLRDLLQSSGKNLAIIGSQLPKQAGRGLVIGGVIGAAGGFMLAGPAGAVMVGTYTASLVSAYGIYEYACRVAGQVGLAPGVSAIVRLEQFVEEHPASKPLVHAVYSQFFAFSPWKGQVSYMPSFVKRAQTQLKDRISHIYQHYSTKK